MIRRLIVAIVAIAVSLVPSVALAADQTSSTVVCRFTDSRFTEISGMTMSLRHPRVLWLHNDSSGGPYIYAVDATTCRTLATVTIAGIEARDIEAIAAARDRKGRPVLWVADIGDNNDSWPDVRLHRIREPATLTSQTVTPRTYRFTYSDRPHNAEAILADPTSQQVWVVTKQLAHGRIYRLPTRLSRKSVNIARPIGTVGGLVTDAAMRPNGSGYVLRDYVNAETFSGKPVGSSLGEIALPFQLQGEAVTWTADGAALLIASERDNRLLRVSLN